jgi:hypothetical protein
MLTIPSTTAKKYIITLLVTSTLFVLSIIWTNHISIQNGGTGITALDLYRYQMAKLDNSDGVETIFLGDSSLGHAIDAEYFGELSDTSALNLALTGSYGLLGSYNMLRHSVARQPIKTAVIMQSLDIFSLEVSHIGYLQTLAGLDAPEEISINMSTYSDIYLNVRTFAGIFKAWKKADLNGMIAEVIDDDYVIQGPKIDSITLGPTATHPMFKVEDIIEDRFVALQLIADYCEEKGINCIFTTAPHFEQVCKNSPEYIAEIINLGIKAGMKTLGGQVCFPPEDIGDSYNHVNKKVKREYTQLFFNKLRDAK